MEHNTVSTHWTFHSLLLLLKKKKMSHKILHSKEDWEHINKIFLKFSKFRMEELLTNKKIDTFKNCKYCIDN